jgi:preprotein translocase subunit SecY
MLINGNKTGEKTMKYLEYFMGTLAILGALGIFGMMILLMAAYICKAQGI